MDDAKALDALRRSERFRPFVKGTLAPGCLVVAAEMRKEATKLLRDLGFSLASECKLASVNEAHGEDHGLALVRAIP